MNDEEKKGLVLIAVGIAVGYLGWPTLALILVVVGVLTLL